MTIDGPLYRKLECGHFRRLSAPPVEVCPYCEDYAEAFAQDVFDALMEDVTYKVVPHTRD